MTEAEWEAVALSLKVAGVATAAGFPVALALAWALARGRFRGRFALDILVHLPLVLPPVVTGWALLELFGRGGAFGWAGDAVLFRWTGAALAAAVMAMPLMVRAMRLSLEAGDRRLEDAARSLGASRGRVLRTVTLPLALPGLIAGAVLGFAKALGEFGATIAFVASIPGETRTVPLAIFAALQRPGGEAAVVRLAAFSLVLAVGALVASELLARRARAHAL